MPDVPSLSLPSPPPTAYTPTSPANTQISENFSATSPNMRQAQTGSKSAPLRKPAQPKPTRGGSDTLPKGTTPKASAGEAPSPSGAGRGRGASSSPRAPPPGQPNSPHSPTAIPPPSAKGSLSKRHVPLNDMSSPDETQPQLPSRPSSQTHSRATGDLADPLDSERELRRQIAAREVEVTEDGRIRPIPPTPTEQEDPNPPTSFPALGLHTSGRSSPELLPESSRKDDLDPQTLLRKLGVEVGGPSMPQGTFRLVHPDQRTYQPPPSESPQSLRAESLSCR